MVGLGDLPGGGFDSAANGVSGDGSVSSATADSASGCEAFRWTSGGGMVGLGDLPGGGSTATPTASAPTARSIVGYSTTPPPAREAFRWTSGGGMVGLGDLPGGAFNSEAYGVSADGSVVVGVQRLRLRPARRSAGRAAAAWSAWATCPAAFSSSAYGVSGDGSVVVGYSNSDSGTEAFRWTADGGMRALWDVLLSHGVDPAADGWTELASARGISADGNTIVGYGIRNGNTEAFVAVIPTIVPEPAAGALALLGVSSILLLRRRSLWRPNKLKVLHFQALAGALTLIAAAPAAAIDTEPLNNSQLTADTLPQLLPGAAISNLAGLGGDAGDIDFFQTPLAAGEVLFGMVTPLAGLSSPFQSPETIVSVFDDSGRTNV